MGLDQGEETYRGEVFGHALGVRLKNVIGHRGNSSSGHASDRSKRG
jgi:hypothetical protein